MTRPTLVAAPLLVQVVTAAEGRCECTASSCHGPQERCPHELPVWQLMAAPADPAVPAAAAWRVPAGDLAAWCGPCLDRACHLTHPTHRMTVVE